MPELPQYARQGLTRPDPDSHPEPDLLAAYAENTLGHQERRQVLGHLSACSACREVVALTLPPTPEAAPISTHISPRREWAILRWGALGATLTIVLAAVLLRVNLQEPALDEEMFARARPAAAPAETSANASPKTEPAGSSGRAAAPEERAEAAPRRSAESQRSVQETKSEIKQTRDAFADQKHAEDRATLPAAPAEADSGSFRADEEKAPAAAPKSQAKAELAPAAAPPPPRAAAEAQEAEAAPVLKKKDTTSSSEPIDRDQMASDSANQRARSAVALDAVNSREAPSSDSAFISGTALRRTAANMRWTVSPTGQLMRLAEGGGAWEPIMVDADRAPRLRAVFAGHDGLWTGGSSGALYFSADGGLTWKRIQPIGEDGTILSGEVTRIEFLDAMQGKLTVRMGRTNQTWNTTDGGRTWSVR